MHWRTSLQEISESAKRRPRRARLLAGVLALCALLALPAHAGASSPSWWQALLDAFAQATLGEDPEGGLSIEPGG